MVKSRREISILKESARITDSCIPVIEEALNEGVTEKELARRVRRHIKSKVASGRNSVSI